MRYQQLRFTHTYILHIVVHKCTIYLYAYTSIKSNFVVGLAYEELEKRLPSEVDIACRNSARNCTISGPKKKVNEIMDRFQAENVFVRQINSSNIAFHSRYVKPVGSVLLRYLQKVSLTIRFRNSGATTSITVPYIERISPR